jgi:hypothetical protein
MTVRRKLFREMVSLIQPIHAETHLALIEPKKNQHQARKTIRVALRMKN